MDGQPFLTSNAQHLRVVQQLLWDVISLHLYPAERDEVGACLNDLQVSSSALSKCFEMYIASQAGGAVTKRQRVDSRGTRGLSGLSGSGASWTLHTACAVCQKKSRVCFKVVQVYTNCVSTASQYDPRAVLHATSCIYHKAQPIQCLRQHPQNPWPV